MQDSNYWRRFSRKRLSRRKVLTVGAAGAGAAALALSGCGGEECGEERAGQTPRAEGTPEEAHVTESEAQAMKLLDEFMATFNARDAKAHAATYNYPSIRLASGPEAIGPEMFDWLVSQGWHHSAWDHRRIIHSSGDKVHFDTRFTRYREDGSKLGTYDSLYIVTNQDGHWGVQVRSSFAP